MQLWRWVFDSSLSNSAEVAQVIDGKAELDLADLDVNGLGGLNRDDG